MSPYLSMLVSLAIVVGLIVAVAFVIKRLGLRPPQATRLMKVVGQLPLGARERLAVVEIDDRWLVVGVTAQNITLIAETAKKEPDSTGQPNAPMGFQSLLKMAAKKRSGDAQ